jgi:hypothetical protein
MRSLPTLFCSGATWKPIDLSLDTARDLFVIGGELQPSFVRSSPSPSAFT